MSREQWGHGYHKGIEDIKNGKKCEYKYVAELTDAGEVMNAYMVWGQNGDTYVLESLRDILFTFNLMGDVYKLSESEEDIDLDKVCQKTRSELSEFHDPVFFINQVAFLGFLASDAKLSDKRWKHAERLGVSIDEYYEKKMWREME